MIYNFRGEIFIMCIKKIVSQLLIFSLVISPANIFALSEKSSTSAAAQIKNLQNQLALLKADKSLSEAKIESLEEQIEKLIEDNETLKEDNEKLKEKNKKLKAKKEKLKKKVEKSSTDSNAIVTATNKIINAYFWDKYGPDILFGGLIGVLALSAIMFAIFE